MHYYSVNNSSDFSQRFVERCKSIGTIAEEFDALEQKFQDMNPMRLELPIRARNTKVSEFANDFVQAVRNSEKKIVTELAKEFRIVQWEILVRNLFEENMPNMQGKLCFHPVTVERDVQGTPDLEEFLIPFSSEARSVERRFVPSYGEIPTKKRFGDDSLSTEGFFLDRTDLGNKVNECHASFQILLPTISEHYPFVHEDLVNAFANMRRSSNKFFNAILIEDGDFSFFSLLWLLRYAVEKYEAGKRLAIRSRKKTIGTISPK